MPIDKSASLAPVVMDGPLRITCPLPTVTSTEFIDAGTGLQPNRCCETVAWCLCGVGVAERPRQGLREVKVISDTRHFFRVWMDPPTWSSSRLFEGSLPGSAPKMPNLRRTRPMFAHLPSLCQLGSVDVASLP